MVAGHGGKRLTVILAALLAVGVLAVYLPATGYPFLQFDDDVYIVANPHVRGGLEAVNIAWAFRRFYHANWHPLTWMSHMLDVEIYGLRPGGHHLTSLLLHALNAALLFLALRKTTGAVWRSWAVAALFALHPLRVESVAWVAERKDVLSALFGLAALLAYAAHVRRPAAGSYAAVFVLFAMGLMAKPMLVTFPFLLLLLDYWPLGRMGRGSVERSGTGPVPILDLIREKLPLLVLSAAVSFLTVAAQREGEALMSLVKFPLSERLANAPVAYVVYLWKAAWPARLAVIYTHPAGGQPAWAWAGALILLAAATAVVIGRARRLPFLVTGWFWYLGALLPVIGLVQVGNQSMADRYTYLPLTGAFIMLAWGAERLGRGRPRLAMALAAGVFVVPVLLAAASSAQLRHWRSNRDLFRHAATVTRDNWTALYNLGTTMAGEGRLDEAETALREALRLKPSFEGARNALAVILDGQGRTAEAVEQLNEVLREDPDHETAHDNLALILEREGRLEEAEGHYRQALRWKPGDVKANRNLSALLLRQGRYGEAERLLAAAVAAEPDAADLRDRLGLSLSLLGRLEEAAAAYREALRLDPAIARIHYNLGTALAGLGREDQAVIEYGEALRLDPRDAEAHNNLGVLLARAGRTPAAAEHFAEAVRLDPGNAGARENLARLQARGGKP